MSMCCVSRFVTQAGLSGLVDVVLVLLYESLDFPDLMSASNIGCDLPWFATRRRSFRLLSPSLAYLGIPADLKRS
jgi:hypothetical protein